jgi:anti-sigma regulatory factor (Ser/Thr protein kinase)
MKKTLTIPACPTEWNGLRESLAALLAGAGVPEDVVDDMILVSEEIFINEVTHGGCGPDGPPVLVHVGVENDLLTLRFEDEGCAFDPLSLPEPDLDAPPDERPIGGLGVYLVGELTDRFSYEREGDRNILHLERRLSR